MEKPDFENLQVYQLSESLADAIWQIVEGYFSDNRRFVRMARGSLNEVIHWLRRAYRRRLLTTEQVNQLKPIIDELSPKLNAYLKYLDNAVKQQRGNND